MPKCSLPTCSKPSVGMFRESPLCKTHLEMARTWEWCFGGPVRLPTLAELKQARGSRGFAEYAIASFLKMKVKYGAIDFIGGTTAYECRKHIQRLAREQRLKIWTFIRGANPYRANGAATLYIVREDLEEKTHQRVG